MTEKRLTTVVETLGHDEFTCSRCGETFEKAWSDEEAATHAAATFPNMPIEDMAVVCEDCAAFMGLDGGNEEGEGGAARS